MLNDDQQDDMGLQDSSVTDDNSDAVTQMSGQGSQSKLREYFARIDFPASKAEILAQAQADGEEQIVSKLKRIPEREYQDENEIDEALTD